MYTESQGGRLGAASGRRLIGAVHARAVELGLDLQDLLHALLQPLSFCSDYLKKRGISQFASSSWWCLPC